MKGTLSLESELGRGSLFRFTMPLVELSPRSSLAATLPAPPDLVASPMASGASSTGAHVLLAEDLDINQQLVTAMLERAGHRVTIANDGAEAITCVDRASAAGWMYDLVLMDIQMPLVDGFQATRTIRARGYHAADLPIVALTANAFPDDIAACLAAGMQGHVEKPIDRAALLAVVARHAEVAANSAELVAAFGLDAKLANFYAVRKAGVLERIDRMVGDRNCDDAEAKALAGELHKLAGTAGLFPEPELGKLAALLERQILEWSERQARVAGCAAQLHAVAA